MNPAAEFDLVNVLGILLVPAVVVAALAFPHPRRLWIRCLIAVIACWLCTIFFTSYVYNPAGIAAGQAAGQHFPEASYDNNTIGIAILFGWFCPAVLVAVIVGIRYLWLERHKSAA